MTGKSRALTPFPARPPSPAWMRGPLPPPFGDCPARRRRQQQAHAAPYPAADVQPPGPVRAAARPPAPDVPRAKCPRGLRTERGPLPQASALLPLPVDLALKQHGRCALLGLPLAQLAQPVAVCVGERIELFEHSALAEWLLAHQPTRRRHEAFLHPLTGQRTSVCALRRVV